MPPEHEHDRLPFLAEPAGTTGRCGEASACADNPRPSILPLPAGEGDARAEGEAKGEQVRPDLHVLSSIAVDLVAERFRVLGEPLRVRIIEELQQGERSVNDLAAAVGATQPNVSKHLRIIQNAGIADRRHDGNLVYYFITDESVFDLCDAVCNSLGEKLEHDASLAEELHEGITRRK